MTPTKLPDTLPGHWDTSEGLQMAKAYAPEARSQLAGGQYSDMHVAFSVASLHRASRDFEPILTMAKDRIRWLSVQLALAQAALAVSNPRATLDHHCEHQNLNHDGSRCLGCGMYAHQFVVGMK